MDAPRAARSVTDVLSDIFGNVQDILHSEIRLAQSEFRDDLARARPAAVLVAAALGGALLSALFALLAILHALRLVMPAWAAALCLAVALAVVSAIALAMGLKRFHSTPAASGTDAHVKENVEWGKGQNG
jgi:hypothetical protein